MKLNIGCDTLYKENLACSRLTRKYNGYMFLTYILRDHCTNLVRFPPDGFTYCLTLFSKCFSSFPHGTCSLSVSCQYLALDGVYHPFWAAIPNNPTLRAQILPPTMPPRTGLSPSPARLSRTTLGTPSRAKLALQTTICRRRHPWSSLINYFIF